MGPGPGLECPRPWAEADCNAHGHRRPSPQELADPHGGNGVARLGQGTPHDIARDPHAVMPLCLPLPPPHRARDHRDTSTQEAGRDTLIPIPLLPTPSTSDSPCLCLGMDVLQCIPAGARGGKGWLCQWPELPTKYTQAAHHVHVQAQGGELLAPQAWWEAGGHEPQLQALRRGWWTEDALPPSTGPPQLVQSRLRPVYLGG